MTISTFLLLAQTDLPPFIDFRKPPGPMEVCATAVYPARLTGAVDAIDSRRVGGTLDFEDLGIDSGSSFDVAIRGDGVCGIWISNITFGGSEILRRDAEYGGKTYPAGSTIRTSGTWLWLDFSGYRRAALAEGLEGFISPSMGVSLFNVMQTEENFARVYVMAGVRGELEYRAASWMSLGVDGGGWIGLSPPSLMCLVVPFGKAAEAMFTFTGGAWVSLELADSVSLRFGVQLRLATAQVGLRGEDNSDSIGLAYGGPSISINIRY